MGNETYKIEVGSPLLRPGLSITTEVSERYLVKTLHLLTDYVRQYNIEQAEKMNAKEEGQLEEKVEQS